MTFFKKKLKDISKLKIVLSVIFIILAGVFTTLVIVGYTITDKLYDQKAGERWDGSADSEAYQFSLFFDDRANIDMMDILTFEHNVGSELDSVYGEDTDASSDEGQEDASYYASAYMTEGKITLTTENSKLEDVKTYGVSGAYDTFHPLEMISGSFLTAEDVHSDCIVVDEDAAWILFGSTDIVGMEVDWDGKPLYIKGVYKEGDSKYEEASKGYGSYANVAVSESGSVNSEGSSSLIYMSYNALKDSNPENTVITSYEFVTVAPSEVFISDLIAKAFTRYINHMELVKNSSRFSIENIFTILKNLGIRVMHVDKIVYPYYENIARAYENLLAVFLLIEIICLFIDIVLFVVFVVDRYHNRKLRWPVIKSKAEDLIEKLRQFKKNEKSKWEHY